MSTPPFSISDEMIGAFRLGWLAHTEYDEFIPDDAIWAALEAVAPLIAVQVLRPDVDLPAEIRGDGPCGDCGTANNIIWFTDNVLWNEVMRQPSAPPDPLLCVACFVRRTHEAGLAPTGWRLVPDWHWETLAEYGARKREGSGRERSPEPRHAHTYGKPCPVTGCDWPSVRTMPTRRLKDCVERWPDAETGDYDPRCCRFPKSCSATVYGPEMSEDLLEPEAANG